MAVTYPPQPQLPVEPRERAVICPAVLRAMAIWPRLDRRAMARCGCDTARLARYISHRTRMPASSIETLLNRP